MDAVVIDYGSGNLRSAAKALERAAAETGARVRVSAEPADVARASHVVLPGVGAFADCRAGLAALPGMVEALHRTVVEGGRPFLGICVGMQLMATSGREHGLHAGLGWIAGAVTAIEPGGAALKVPHMGWNALRLRRPDHPLLAGLETGSHVYFVHGYHLVPDDPEVRAATVDYGGALTAMVAQGNLAGTQFHPEKSQAAGLRLLGNFLRWRP